MAPPNHTATWHQIEMHAHRTVVQASVLVKRGTYQQKITERNKDLSCALQLDLQSVQYPYFLKPQRPGTHTIL